jgi:hypothetical protein
MSALDFLYISLAVGFLTLVGFLCYLITKVVETLKKVEVMLENIENTTDNVVHFKDKIKSSTLRVISKFLKGGKDYVPREYQNH